MIQFAPLLGFIGKGASFASVPLALFRGASFTTKLIVIGVLVAGITLFYFNWKNGVKKEESDRIFKIQLEDHLKQQREQVQKLVRLREIRIEIERKLEEQRKKLDEETRKVEEEIQNNEDGEVAPVLRSVIEAIRKSEGLTE